MEKIEFFRNLELSIASFGGIGFAPYAPGTIGSIAALPIVIVLSNHHWWYIAITILLFVAGTFVGNKAEMIYHEKDPGWVVVDEVVGMLISFFLVPISGFSVIIGFILFRLIDISKVFPLNQLEKVPGGLGIMLDDAIGGVMVNIILNIIIVL